MSEQAEAIRILTEAKNRVERGWCQGDFALDADGQEADPQSESACAWCTLGAVHAAASVRAIPAGSPVGRILIKAIGCELKFVVGWNDTPGRTQEEVVAAFDRAIAQAKEVSYE